MGLKHMLKKLILGTKTSSSDYVAYLRSLGMTIGDNVVIGANSLINKDVPDNCVVVGNPQRVVRDIDSYLEKRRAAQVSEAADLYDCWRRNSPEGKRGGWFLRNAFSASSFGCSSRGIHACSATRLSRRLWPCAELAA